MHGSKDGISIDLHLVATSALTSQPMAWIEALRTKM
jgi:hypothetical protein